MTHFVAIGECMVELSPTPTEKQFGLGYAGDTLNTAWYLKRLLSKDDQVDYFTAIGTDTISDQLMVFLQDAGIGTATILRRDDRTLGLYLIQLQDGERSFAYWRSQSAARTLAQDPDVIAQALNGADMAYLSGITLAILPEADRANLFSVLNDFRKAGGKVVFDPNLRPKLWRSADDMRNTISAMANLSDMVLPSFDDEAHWFGDANTEVTAMRYARAGASCVIVKNGPGNIVVKTDQETFNVSPQQNVKVVDTTAAGDSFNAGFLAALLRGDDLRHAVTQGAALSARVIGQYGALVANID